ncbi:MAG: NAD-dependent epimerase/dehydratase family protein [Subdoligranulum sp.]
MIYTSSVIRTGATVGNFARIGSNCTICNNATVPDGADCFGLHRSTLRGERMNILVTGAKGMVGTALCNNLKNIRDGKNKTRPALDIKEIYEYDLDSTPEELDEYCRKADFVFNLAGVNRPENPEDFMKGNFGFASDSAELPEKAQQQGNHHAVLLHSGYAGWSVSATASTAAARRLARSCSSSMLRRPGQRWRSTVS